MEQEIEAKKKQKAHDEQERIAKKKSKTRTNFFVFVIVVGVFLVGYWLIPPSFVSPTDYTNSIGMEFMLISAGEFDMGSPSDEVGRSNNEGPVHTVTIEKAYYLGKYEVTHKQWREIMGDNPLHYAGDDCPIEKVSWNDAQEFIKKLNQKEGTDKYRLPSEAEWEYAARAGTTTRYSFGDSKLRLGGYAWCNYKSWFQGCARYTYNSGSKTHPVGQKKPNSWGLYDMHGNVWEWVQDEWHVNYDGAPTDGSVWGDDGSIWVNRGGSFSSSAHNCRSAARKYGARGFSSSDVGFRLLKEL